MNGFTFREIPPIPGTYSPCGWQVFYTPDTGDEITAVGTSRCDALRQLTKVVAGRCPQYVMEAVLDRLRYTFN